MALARTRVPRYYVRPHPLHSFANAELTSLFLFATLPICLALAWRPAAVPGAITTSVLVFILCAVWNVHLSRATSFVWATLTATVVAGQLIVVLSKSGASIAIGTDAIVNGVFVYGFLWIMEWRASDRGLQPLATAALLLPCGLLARPVVFGCCAVLCTLAFMETRRPLLSTATLVLTPSLLCLVVILTLSRLTNHSGVAALGHKMSLFVAKDPITLNTPASLMRQLAPSFYFCIGTLLSRLIQKSASTTDLLYFLLCLVLATMMLAGRVPGTLNLSDLNLIIYGGSAYLLASTPSRTALAYSLVSLLTFTGLVVALL